MLARISEGGVQRGDGFISPPRIEDELVVQLREADVLRSEVAVQQQPATVHGAIVVQHDGASQFVESVDVTVQIAKNEARIQPRSRVAWIETLRGRERRESFGKPVRLVVRLAEIALIERHLRLEQGCRQHFEGPAVDSTGGDLQHPQTEMRLAKGGITGAGGVKFMARPRLIAGRHSNETEQ